MKHRGIALAGVVVLVLSACGSPDAPGAATTRTGSVPGTVLEQGGTGAAPEIVDTATAGAEPFAVEQIASSPIDVVASAIEAWRSGIVPNVLPPPLIDGAELRSGGPPPDGIPSIDEPRFLNPDDVNFLADNEPVLALEIDGDARAYPVQILTWHEIVNDTVGGIPVGVTYCPLCNSALAYDRRVEVDGVDEVLDFGTSGLLYNSSLVMYDRQTQSLWSHFTGQAVMGELTGIELDDYAVATVAWNVWRDTNPDGLVLSRETGFDRSYGSNPYPGYDDVDGVPFLFEGEADGRYTALTRILGFEADGVPLGVPLVDLQQHRVIAGPSGDRAFVAWWTAGTSSALDSSTVAAGYDVGATGVFVAGIDGDPLTFSATGDLFIDDQTGSTWNVLGHAVDGELAGKQLEPLPHVDTFWFAWSTFHPDTLVVTGEPPR
jgi:hypothetical protein